MSGRIKKLKKKKRKHIGKQIFLCSICNEIFSTKYSLQKHSATHRQIPIMYTCKVCHQSFWNIRMFQNHEETHHAEDKTFTCEYCETEFGLDEDLKIHLRLHARENFYQCLKCKKSFSSKLTYRQHLTGCESLTTNVNKKQEKGTRKQALEKTNPNKKASKINWKQSFKCHKCYTICQNTEQLQDHLKQHCSKGEYICKCCDKIFTTHLDMTMHLNKHAEIIIKNCDEEAKNLATEDFMENLVRHCTNKRQSGHRKNSRHQCSNCDAEFTKTVDLKKHVMTHHSNELVDCKICLEKFKSKHAMEDHTRTHFGKDYCFICSRKFKYHGHFIRHVKMHYDNHYRCTTCPSTFDSYKRFRSHLELHKVKPRLTNYTCSTCNLKFKSEVRFKTHLKLLHSSGVKCKICLKKFSTSTELDEHFKRLHKGKKYNYKCYACGALFTQNPSLKRHIRRHTGAKPYTCTYCFQKFGRKDTMQDHINIHTNEKPFSCPICKLCFRQRGMLNVHTLKNH